MAEAASRLYVPALGGIYSAVNEYAEPILRIGVGAILIPHGMQKLFGTFGGMGLTNNAALFERLGYTPGMFWGTLAGAVLIFMIVAVKFTSAKGFFWSAGGYEYPLLIGLCALFFLIRGGGQCSLDRMIGREI
jgi:putative oxidoreductase